MAGIVNYMNETEFVALLDRLVARDQWLTDIAVPIYQRAAHSIGRSVKDPAVRAAFGGWIAEATAVATRHAEGQGIADGEIITLGVRAAIVAHRLAQAGATAEAQPTIETAALGSDQDIALGSDQDIALAQARARVDAAQAALAVAQAEAYAAEMALAEIVVNAGAQVPAQAETETTEVHEDVQDTGVIAADTPTQAQANAGAKTPAKERVKDTRPRIHVARPSRHSVPKQRDHRPRIRRAETVVA